MRTTRPQRGFSLIELMIAVAIGLVVTLAATGILIRSESGKRTTVSTNDINQTGAYLSYTLDRALRSAGSGYTQKWAQAFGCALHAQHSGSTMLPRPSAWPAPFASLPMNPVLAPVVIYAGASQAGSDVLAVMTGNAGFGESPPTVTPGSVTATSMNLRNTLGLRGDDLVLVYDDSAGCVLQQVQTGFVGSTAQTLPFAGDYAAGTVDGVDMTTLGLGSMTFAIDIGNVSATNAPQFQFIGVGTNNTLSSYDLLQLGAGDDAQPIAEGVVEMRALYGVDSNDDGSIDTWEDPATSPWTAAELTDGSTGARTNLRRILAVRVGLVLRSQLIERDVVAPSTLTLFGDLPAAVQRTVNISTADQHSRYRTVEVTVPLRNLLLLPIT
jgi:type IV pilus assembly protein PilW